MKIWEIQSENFKKLNVSLSVKGKSVTVTGDNEVGKSSFIDAIFKTLTGEKIKGTPVQLGKPSAKNKIVIRKDNGDTITVEKSYDGEKTSLTVKLNGSAKVKSPQAFLDETLGEISFDPLIFVNKTPLEQSRFLMEILDIDLEPFENEKRKYLDEKQEVEKDLNKIEKDLEELPLCDKEYHLIDSANIVKEYEEINEKKREQQKIESDLRATEAEHQTQKSNLLRIQNEIEQLTEKIAKLKEDESATVKHLRKSNDDMSTRKIELSKIVIPEATSLEEKLKEININNDYYKAQQERIAKQKEYDEVELRKTEILSQIRRVEIERKEKLSSAQIPVPGLDFQEDGGLSYEGLKLTEDNISTSRIIEIGIRLSMALNPNLRILQIKDGSLLGGKMMELVKKVCKEEDYQLFVEKVTDDKEIGFIIEEEVHHE